MKRVLYFQHAGAMGGAPRSLSFLIEKLDKSKYQPTVVIVDEGPAVELFEKIGAKTIVNKKIKPFHGSTVSGMNIKILLNNLFWFIPTYFESIKVIREIKPDIIHLNSSCLFMVAKAAKKSKIDAKVICHVREPLLPNIFGNILKYMNNKYVDEFICIDKFDAESTCKKDNFEVIYNFVDFDTYNKKINSNVIRKELSLKKEDVIFLYLARIAPSNGTLPLVNFWNKYAKENQKLVIVGDDIKCTDKYNIQVRNCASNKVAILPFRNDIPEIISSSDVMICPFIEPHFSRAIIEAAACGKPSIGSKIGGVLELIMDGQTGIMYNYHDFSGLLEAMDKLMNQNVRKQMGEKAYQFAIENFNADINAARTIKHYER